MRETGHAEAIVVGGGPAGSTAARELARLGRTVILLEAKRYPRIKTCAGGISPGASTALGHLGLWERIAPETYDVCGIRLVAPSGAETLWVGAASASVLQRSRLDYILAHSAAESGAEIRENHRVSDLVLHRGRAVGVRLTTGEVLHAPWIIIATGARGRFDKDPRPRRVLWTCMARYEGVDFHPNVLEMIFDPVLAHHYGWLFPESDTTANIGICLEASRAPERSVRRIFERFLKHRFGHRLARARSLGPWRGFPISVSDRIQHRASPGVLLAGEACRLVNSATGEGICNAILSGAMAARLVDGALRRNRDPNQVALAYKRWLQLRLGPSLRSGEWFLRRGMPLLELTARFGQIPWLRRRLQQP